MSLGKCQFLFEILQHTHYLDRGDVSEIIFLNSWLAVQRRDNRKTHRTNPWFARSNSLRARGLATTTGLNDRRGYVKARFAGA